MTEEDDPQSWLSPTSRAEPTFLRFAARLAQNAEQVLRYEFDGRPLLYSRKQNDEVARAFPNPSPSSSSETKITTIAPAANNNNKNNTTPTIQKNNHMPKCESCGGGRVFEFQLTPHAILELEAEEEGLGTEGMEWGTVVVGVCAADCVVGFGGGGEASTVKGENKRKVGWVEEWVSVSWEEGV
ncbi:MAG: hypothetical protein Q9216_007239 [Gyalolechia sp. 2 TL-2023]